MEIIIGSQRNNILPLLLKTLFEIVSTLFIIFSTSVNSKILMQKKLLIRLYLKRLTKNSFNEVKLKDMNQYFFMKKPNS